MRSIISRAAESLQVCNGLRTLPGSLFNGSKFLGNCIINPFLFEQLNITQDSCQAVVKVMGNPTCHLPQ